ncbi:AP-3 complex subunit mu-2, partial [Rhizophlyctis rosea]
QVRWTVGKVSPDFGVTGVPVLSGSIYMENSDESIPLVNTISVDFKINMHTSSGLRIDSLQVHNEPYKPYKGVRTLTKAGRYQIRI